MTNASSAKKITTTRANKVMDFAGIRQALGPGVSTQLNIYTDTLTESFSNFLSEYYYWQNQTIQIDNVKMEIDENAKTLKFSGVSSYLNMPNIPLVALFRVDSKGAVQATLKYCLIGEQQTSSYWRFSKSFPDLPIDFNYLSDTHEYDFPALDLIQFNQAYFIVTTEAHQEEQFQVELHEGINFVGSMKPLGVLGIFGNLFKPTQELTLFGSIHVPKNNAEVYIPKAVQDLTAAKIYPWDLQSELPGIHLQAKLNTEIKIGSIQLKDTLYRVYYPLSKEWLKKDKVFQGVRAITANLDLSESNVKIETIALLEQGLNSVSVETRFDGVSFKNLSELAGITGSSSVLSQLPEAMKQAVSSLSKLELMDLGFTLSYGNKKLSLDYTTVQIGMPDLNWKVWGDHLVVDSAGCRFSISSPFNKPKFEVGIWGKTEIEGIPVIIKAEKSEGFILMAKLEEKQTIPLKQLMQRYLPQVPPPANLTVNNLFIAVAPKRFYQMSCVLAEKPSAWTFKIGPTQLAFSNLRLDINIPNQGQTSGNIRGEIAFGKNVTLEASYSMPGEFVIQTEIEQISLKTLTKKFSSSALAVPSGFDLSLRNTSILIKKENNVYIFQAATEIDKVGIIACEVRKQGNQWGIAAGVSLKANKISTLPGLQALSAIEKVVSLQDLTLVVSSYQATNFRFPDMAAFGNPVLTSHSIKMPNQANGVIAGLNVYAKWKLNSNNKQHKLLQNFLGVSSDLGVTLQVGKIPQKEARLYVNYSTKIDGKWPLACQFGLAMNQGTPEIFLAGDLTVKIQKKPCNFSVAMSIVKSGAFLSGTMKGTLEFEGIQLSNLALAVGVNWGGIPSLGVAANISTPSFNSSVALFFDSTNPARSVLAGSVSDLNLNDIVTSVASAKKMPKEIGSVLKRVGIEGTRSFLIPASVASVLDARDLAGIAQAFSEHGKIKIPSVQERVLLVINKPGSAWHLTDLQNEMRNYQIKKDAKTGKIRVSIEAQLYCAPQYSQIGTLQFQQGFFLNGTLNILGLKSTSTIEVSTNKGVAVESYLNKALIVGDKNLFKLSDVNGKSGPRVSLSTFSQPNNAEKLFRKPHFYIDGRLVMMGLKSSCFVQIAQSGCIFLFDQKASSGFSIPGFSGKSSYEFSVNGKINFDHGMDITTMVMLMLNGKIQPGKLINVPKGTPLKAINNMGSIKLGHKIKGSVRVQFDGKRTRVAFASKVKLTGLPAINIKLALNASNDSLLNLGDMVCKEIERELKKVLRDATQWVRWVDKGFISGVKNIEQVGSVLSDVFRHSPDNATKLLKGVGKDAAQVGRVLNKVYKLNPKETEKFLKKSFKISDKDLKNVLKGAGYAAKEVDKFFGNVGKEIGKAAKKLKFW